MVVLTSESFVKVCFDFIKTGWALSREMLGSYMGEGGTERRGREREREREGER